MKKFILLLMGILIMTGCSSIAGDKIYKDERYLALEDKVKEYETKLEKYDQEIEKYENELKIRTEELESETQKLNDSQAQIGELKEENNILEGLKRVPNVYFDYYEKHFKPAIPPHEAEAIISERSLEAIKILSEKDFVALANMIHPTLGIRFTPYTFVEIDDNLVFSKDEIKGFGDSDKLYVWGVRDGIGTDIEMKVADYFMRFVYDQDYINSEKTGYNQIVSNTGWVENQFGIYHNSIVVEYYFSGFNPDFHGMDWRSLRIVFQEYNNEWYIVGIIHNEWTI